MRDDAAQALAGLGPTSPYRATMLHTEGLSYLLEGDLERADASFAHAYDLAVSIEASPVTALVLAEQFHVAVERDDWTAAESLIKRALEVVARGPFDEYWTSALVFASAAREAAHRGDMSEAREHAGRAARLRPLLTYALPVVSLQALVELARAYLALVDPAGRPRRARAGPRHPAAAARPRHARDGRSQPGGAGQPDHRRHAGRRLVVDGCRAPPGAAAAHPPDLSGDRRAALHLPPHREDAGRARCTASSAPPRARRRSSGSRRWV